MKLSGKKPLNNIGVMLPIWKRQSVKTALSSRIISTSRTTTATASFWKTAWDARKYRKKKRSLLQTVLIQEKQTMILPKKRTSVWLIPIYPESLSMISLQISSLTKQEQRFWDVRQDMNQNPVDIQEVNPSSSIYRLKEISVQDARTKTGAKRRFINESVQ